MSTVNHRLPERSRGGTSFSAVEEMRKDIIQPQYVVRAFIAEVNATAITIVSH